MCGIAGTVSVAPLDKQQIVAGVEAMNRSLARRGPDDEGVATWAHAALGHRRLAIFDLTAAGHQPMLSPDGTVGVVFNGAIYNFVELRQQLTELGYEFSSRTDTEVLVHGFGEWGIDELVRRLKGMFAFAIWDDRDHSLYLVRDRLGVKPLVFWADDGQLFFASTVRALKTVGAVGEIDASSVLEFLRCGYLSDDRSIYRQVTKVPAASIVRWKNGSTQVSNYWSALPHELNGSNNFEDAVEQAEALFLDAVSRRLRADVPVAALLSGGIDSGLVCWAVAKLGGNVTAYTVSVPGDPWDETDDARVTAERIGIRHEVLEMSNPQFDDLDSLVAAFSEPFAIASAIGMLGISEQIRQRATVLLTGDGGDDVFLGYPRHRHLHLATQLRRYAPPMALSAWTTLRPLWPRVGPLRRAAALMDYAATGLNGYLAYGDRVSYLKDRGILGPRLTDVYFTRERPRHPRREDDSLRKYLAHAYETQFVGEYLPKVDGSTMYHALEARSPFLDQDLWAFASELPYQVRLHSGRLKAVLREVAKRRLGRDIAARKKQGFGVPVQRWLTREWRGQATELFRDSYLAAEGWIDSDCWLKTLAEFGEGDTLPPQMWYMLVLEKWFRLENGPVAPTGSYGDTVGA